MKTPSLDGIHSRGPNLIYIPLRGRLSEEEAGGYGILSIEAFAFSSKVPLHLLIGVDTITGSEIKGHYLYWR